MGDKHIALALLSVAAIHLPWAVKVGLLAAFPEASRTRATLGSRRVSLYLPSTGKVLCLPYLSPWKLCAYAPAQGRRLPGDLSICTCSGCGWRPSFPIFTTPAECAVWVSSSRVGVNTSLQGDTRVQCCTHTHSRSLIFHASYSSVTLFSLCLEDVLWGQMAFLIFFLFYSSHVLAMTQRDSWAQWPALIRNHTMFHGWNRETQIHCIKQITQCYIMKMIDLTFDPLPFKSYTFVSVLYKSTVFLPHPFQPP